MIIDTKIKSDHKTCADFKSNSESVKSHEWFYPKKYQSDNLA